MLSITMENPTGLIAPIAILDEGLTAPRGICLHGDYLITADTAQNKVFIFQKEGDDYSLRFTLGNEDNMRNECIASSLQYPSGIWTDGKILIVADAWHHRVLIWSDFVTRDYQPADIVIGQAGCTGSQPNVDGLLSAPSAQSLYWPYGVWSDGGALWIADTGNRRVLYYNKIPTQNFAAADAVIGQDSFKEKEYDPDNAIWPYSVKVSSRGELIISDTQYYRCLYWKNHATAFTERCDFILGQPDMQSNGQNQYRLRAAENTLSWCYDAAFSDDKILIADTGNSRILFFENIMQHNPPAGSLIGQEHFNINGEGSLSMKSSDDHSLNLYWPFSISCHGDMLAVADTGKSRLLIYKITEL